MAGPDRRALMRLLPLLPALFGGCGSEPIRDRHFELQTTPAVVPSAQPRPGAVRVSPLTARGFIPLARPVAQTRFAEAIPDLPLMAGLVEQPGAVVFDKPSGRIVEMDTTGTLARPDVEAFYAETLPSLGWQPKGSGLFERERESLRLVFRSGDGGLTVRFVLAPRE